MIPRKVADRLSKLLIAGLTLVAVLGLVPSVAEMADPAAAQTPLVPETPSTGYPVIQQANQYDVWAADQVGDYILSGGDFQQIRLQNGTLINQPYFTGWHIDTKQIICTNITFDDEVLEIIPGNEPNTAFVAGRFRNITAPNGTFKRSKLVKIELPTCNVDTTFDVQGTWGKVSELALHDNRLFVAGDFSQINNQPIGYLAQLDPNTGTVNPNFNLNVVKGLSTVFRGIGVNPAGTRLVLGGRWSSISGVATGPTAVINIANPNAPFLTAHRSTGTVATMDLQDASVSPDGTKIALAYGTATVSDYVYVFDTVEQTVSYRWRKFMRDSSFGVGMTDDIVYVGGHFCKIDAGPGPTDTMAPNGIDFCTGVFYPGGAWRTQLAALSANDGTPLTWNPGNNTFRGAREITVTERGLLVGYDGDRTNGFLVGPLAFFDYVAGNDNQAPGNVTITQPQVNQEVVTPVHVEATATDNTGVVVYEVRWQNSNGQWVQADGSLGANAYAFVVAANQNGDLSTDFAINPQGIYTLSIKARDAAGNRSSTWSTRTVNVDDGFVDPPQSCTAVIYADGRAEISWDAVNIPDYQVRRNGNWIATVTGTSYTDFGATMATDYSIRIWPGAGPADTPCNNVDGGGASCQAVITAFTAVLDWDTVPGNPSYQILVNGIWQGQTNGTTYTLAGSLADTFTIRYWLAGTPFDLDCNNVDGGGNEGPSCTAAVTGGTAVLTWDTIDGNPAYQILKNGIWQGQTNGTTYTLAGSLADAYTIRYWLAGFPFDLECDNEDGGAGPSCSKVAAAGNVELTWDPVPNNASYFVRLNGVWLATVNGTSYTHAGGNIADDYSIRVWLAGTPVDINCTQ